MDLEVLLRTSSELRDIAADQSLTPFLLGSECCQHSCVAPDITSHGSTCSMLAGLWLAVECNP